MTISEHVPHQSETRGVQIKGSSPAPDLPLSLTRTTVQLPMRCQPNSLPILALDLDETLVHVPRDWYRRGQRYTYQDIQALLALPKAVKYQGNPAFVVSCTSADLVGFERPHVRWVLANLACAYTLVVYTAGSDEYAAKAVAHLDPARTLISAYLSRGDLHEIKCTGGVHVGPKTAKDLARVCDDMSRVLLVDDRPYNLVTQPFNGIRIRPWHGDAKDQELRRLGFLLLSCAGAPDVRSACDQWQWDRE